MFSGLYTALITPLKNNQIDYLSLEKIIENQIAGGVDGLVPMGTTGESATMSFAEHQEIIERVVQIVSGRVKVVAGTGANSTAEAIHLSQTAEKSGVDGVLLVNPYYNKPSQNGLIAHFEKIAKSISVPIILYNIPGRTAINFTPESIAELLERVENVKAVKEASGDINQMMRLYELVSHKINLLSGDDNLLLPVLSIGGKGVISVLANILPAEVKKVITLFETKKIAEAQKAFYKLLPLCRGIFLETNPIPIKIAMELLGFCSSEMRLPLYPLEDKNKIILKNLMLEYGILKK